MKIKITHPLVSCICVTQNRSQLLLKTIISFDQQNYPNTELVISYPKNDHESKRLVAHIIRATEIKIITVERDENETIGTARNNAIKASTGDYVCMWDDDDIHFFSRVADQYNLLQGEGRYFESSVLMRILLYDTPTKSAYLSFYDYWGGTLLCKKEHILQYPCTDTNQFECKPVIDYLKSKKLIFEMSGNPSLYVSVYHGKNLISDINFQYLCKKSDLLDKSFSKSIHQMLSQHAAVNI